MSVILKLLSSDNFIPVNRTLIKTFGLAEAVILGELCAEYNYWEKENKLNDDMFYCSASKLEDKTGLSEYQQRKALQNLKDVEIIEIKLKGIPATKYFKINTNKLLSFLQTSSEETKELDVKKLQSSNIINNKTISNKQSKSKDLDCTEKFTLNHSKKSDTTTSKEVEMFKDLYNEHCSNLPKVVKLTDKRIKAIKNLVKKYSYDDIVNAFDLANNSDFLIGNNDRGWKADIDFLLREDKFINILEGKYGGRKKKRFEHEGKCVPITEEKKKEIQKFHEELRKNGKQITF